MKVTFESFLFEVMVVLKSYDTIDWRIGQTIMNVLRELDIKKYDEITGTEYDCFYVNGRVEWTLKKLKEDWK